MNLSTISIDQDEAIEQLGRYRQAVKDHPDDTIYRSVERGLRWLARTEVEGLLDIRRAISEGGEHDDLTPRLAIMRADMRWCWLGRRGVNGSVQFWHKDERHRRAIHGYYDFHAGTLSSHESGDWGQDQRWRQQHGLDHSWTGSTGRRAMVPMVPPDLRPVHHLRNYEILWEVDEWERVSRPPVDPVLLRHVGGDLYAIYGVWDLTELERAVLAGERR